MGREKNAHALDVSERVLSPLVKCDSLEGVGNKNVRRVNRRQTAELRLLNQIPFYVFQEEGK